MMNVGGRDRLTPMTGAAAVVLWVAGVLVIGGGHVGFPGGLPEERAGEVLDFYVANADRVIAGSWAFMLGALSFLWFTGRLSTTLAAGISRPSGDSGARLASGAGAFTGALLLLSAAAGLVPALAGQTLDAAAAQAVDGMGGVFFIGAEMTAVAMLASLALLTRRTGALPRAWSVATLTLAVWLAVLPIGWVGLIVGVPIWTLTTAALLLRPNRRETSAMSRDLAHSPTH